MFVERVGDDALAPLAAAGGFVYVDPDEPAVHGRIAVVRAHGPGRGAAGAADGRRERPERPAERANPGRPDMEATRANEATVRAVVAFVRRAA